MAPTRKRPAPKKPQPEPPKRLRYSEALASVIAEAVAAGKTLAQISRAIGVAESTLRYWQIEHAELRAMVHAAREVRADTYLHRCESLLDALDVKIADKHEVAAVRTKVGGYLQLAHTLYGQIKQGRRAAPADAKGAAPQSSRDAHTDELLERLEERQLLDLCRMLDLDPDVMAEHAAIAQMVEDLESPPCPPPPKTTKKKKTTRGKKKATARKTPPKTTTRGAR